MELQLKLSGFDDLKNRIKNLTGFLDDPSRFFAEGKLIAFQNVMRHFQDQMGPSGPWAPLKIFTMTGSMGRSTRRWNQRTQSYRERRGRVNRAMILQDTGRLRLSITGRHGPKGFEVGTGLDYAAAHQFGVPARNLPARTFVWLDDDSGDRIVDRFMYHVRMAL